MGYHTLINREDYKTITDGQSINRPIWPQPMYEFERRVYHPYMDRLKAAFANHSPHVIRDPPGAVIHEGKETELVE